MIFKGQKPLWEDISELAGYTRCAVGLTVHSTVNVAGLENIWFVGMQSGTSTKNFLALCWFRKCVLSRLTLEHRPVFSKYVIHGFRTMDYLDIHRDKVNVSTYSGVWQWIWRKTIYWECSRYWGRKQLSFIDYANKFCQDMQWRGCWSAQRPKIWSYAEIMPYEILFSQPCVDDVTWSMTSRERQMPLAPAFWTKYTWEKWPRTMRQTSTSVSMNQWPRFKKMPARHQPANR